MTRATREFVPTFAGVFSILFWSTTVGVARRVSEDLGPLLGASTIFLAGGIVGAVYTLIDRRRRTALCMLPSRYLFICGSLFVAYSVFLYLGIGYAEDGRQTMGVALLNYLWPALIIIFSIFLQSNAVRPAFLVPGIVAGLVGGWFAVAGATPHPGFALSRAFSEGALFPYACGIVAAIVWGLYSNLSRVYAADFEGDAVSFFLLATGIVLSIITLVVGVDPTSVRLSPSTGWLVAYMALVPSLAAYTLWDVAMRRGRIVLVASLSYATPLLSTAFSSIVLAVFPGRGLWIAASLVVLGAILCSRGVSP